MAKLVVFFLVWVAVGTGLYFLLQALGLPLWLMIVYGVLSVVAFVQLNKD